MSSRRIVREAVSGTANKTTAKPNRDSDRPAMLAATELPPEGSANAEIHALVVQVWRDEAEKAGISVEGFDVNASRSELVAWARSAGLLIAAVLSRFSTKMQHSTEAHRHQ